MKDIKIYVSKETRKVDIERSVIGNDAENLQGNLVFLFCDDFVDGIARIEYTINGESHYQMLEKQDEKYIIPIKSVLTKKGQIDMQLVITEHGEYQLTSDTKYKANKFYFVKEGNVYTQLIEGTDYEINDDITGEVCEMVNIPIFKSNIFYLVVNKSINAEGGEAPEEYKSWIEIANQKLIEIDEKIEEVGKLNIETERVEDGVEITITKKDGTKDTKKVNDGEKGETGEAGPQGEKGDPALINGYNTIEIVSGTNIEVSQEENTLKINNTYDDTSILQNISTLNSAIEEHDRDIQNLQNDIERIDEDIQNLEFEVNDIEDLIPNQATTSNQLADKNFVNSSIATNTAYFRGTFNSVAELMAYSGEKTLNDYAYVVIYDEVITTQVKQYDRYKYNGTTWVYEYTLNNSSFTAQQWASINSGITQALTEQITTNQTNINNLQAGKQDNLTAGTGISIQNNVISAENTGKVVEIGSNQYSYDGYILPAISVDILRNIYTDDRAGTPQLLHWTLYGSENNFKVVSSDSIAGEYSIDILVHNKYHCAYTWTNQTTGIVNPIVITSETLTTDDIEKTLYYDTKSTANEGDIITTKSALDWRTNNIEVDGNYKQETTTGKNKYEGSQDFSGTWNNASSWETASETYNGLVVKKREGKWAGLNKDINVESGKTYTFSFYLKADANRLFDIYISGGTAEINPSSTQNKNATTDWQRFSLTFTCSVSGTVKARAENNSESSGNFTYICGYQLEEGNLMTDYEPYTNGASPNPDYPQEIEVVDELSIKETGKNSLNIPNGVKTHNGITGTITNNCELTYSGTATGAWANITETRNIEIPIGTYTFSIDVATTENERIVLYLIGETEQSVIITQGTTSRTVSTTKAYTGYRIGITNIYSGTSYNGKIKMQFEKGTTATTYEPYQETIYPIDLQGNTINKVGNIKNKLVIDKQGNVNLVKIVSSKYNIPTGSTSITISDMKSNGSILSSVGGTVSDKTITFSSATPENAYLYYELATPTTINLGKLPTPIKTKEGINNIELLTNIDTTFNVKYVMNIKDYIDSLQ